MSGGGSYPGSARTERRREKATLAKGGGGGAGRGLICHTCSGHGHPSRLCPTVDANATYTCRQCGGKGHFARECPSAGSPHPQAPHTQDTNKGTEKGKKGGTPTTAAWWGKGKGNGKSKPHSVDTDEGGEGGSLDEWRAVDRGQHATTEAN